MRNEAYGKYLSDCYDRLNSHVSAEEFANFCVKCFERFADAEVKHVCEIACGTGSVAVALEKKGYRITASDLSEDMLSIADNKAFESGCRGITFTRQDMRSFTVSGKTDAVICFLDSLNCLLTPKDVKQCFESAYNVLSDGGIFVFDINSKYKFEKLYAQNDYVLEDEGVVCAWRNYYDESKKICDFDLSFFIENEDGLYERHDESVRERMYTEKNIISYLKNACFDEIYSFCGFDFGEADENRDERIFFVAKKSEKKNER